jgi:electron-transferring-flavoprotein dehydrogenase
MAIRSRQSWLWERVARCAQHSPGVQVGLWGGLAYGAIDTFIFRGKAPWTLAHHDDHTQLGDKLAYPKIAYPKPDGKLTFDRLSSVFLSATNHEENQQCHLRLKDESVPISINYARYGAPETRYCPAGVYEILGEEEGQPRLQINGQNCLHCKTCDIKDPTQNIVWTVPEGGGGPNYPNM